MISMTSFTASGRPLDCCLIAFSPSKYQPPLFLSNRHGFSLGFTLFRWMAGLSHVLKRKATQALVPNSTVAADAPKASGAASVDGAWQLIADSDLG